MEPMAGLGLAIYLGAAVLAWVGTHSPRGRSLCLKVAGLCAAAFAVTVLASWVFGMRGPFTMQIGLILMYGLCYALLPAGLLRPFASRRWAAPLALTVALLMPFAGLAVFRQWGESRRAVVRGMGVIEDLLFLHPVEMGEGVNSDGAVTKRYQIHYLVLAAATAAAVALQLLPRDRRAPRGAEPSA
jgi:hypothetical protein